MKTKEFIKQYNSRENKADFCKNHISTTYVPYETKVDKCLKILDSTCYRKNEKTGKKELHIVSTSIYVLYTMVLVQSYTDIEIDFSNIVSEFNLLNNRNYLVDILNEIPEKETVEFKMILDMCQSDMMINEYQVGAYVKNRIEDVSIILGATLSPFLEKFGEVMANLDENKIEKLLKRLQK